MNIHIGKAILKKLEEAGISKSEFGRRISKSPQNVQDIFTRQSIDTKLLFDISKALKFNFFTLFVKDTDLKQLGDLVQGKDKLKEKVDELTNTIQLLKSNLKDKERIISIYEKKTPKKK